MSSKALFFAAILASVEARFGQEGIPAAAVGALGNRGQPGQAATLSGQIPGVLLAAASACAKLELADQIVTQLGSTDDVIAAARGLVAAEMNFNPFAVSIPKICDDATLPATQELRGIVPLVDPAVTGSDVQNANSKKSLTAPFDSNGLSVAAISIAQGFSNFTRGDTGTPASGGAGAGAGAGAGNNNGGNQNNNGGNQNNNGGNQNNNGGNQNNNGGNQNNNGGNQNNNGGNQNNNGGNKKCNGGNQNNNNKGNGNANQGNGNGNQGNGNGNGNQGNGNGNGNQGNGNGNQGNGNGNGNQGNGNGNGNQGNGNGNGALDFGTCKPTIEFAKGRPNRKADEGTFLPVDPAILKGQSDALNPSIIMNRVCDQLNSRTCNANQAAITKCLDAKKQVEAAGTRDATTADLFNSLVQG
ncbi:hypothetical protein MAPG_07681 [Magnaporthiopsis poae ATCC 64411]|uniref:Circumsporozoite protein n=1 Tax=Magnaporthiopsis poae (strain ATCC 64411 / 73-15) TaxID=644358 RepID=A0A0C4E5B5_MAGP6|nr:hypothetical protein MAPG_07681 [Magnaporthiopsis poae ATCC 64411]